MAAPTVRQIRQGLADRVGGISGLRVFSTIPGQFSVPAGIVAMPERAQTETFQRGTDRWNVTVWIIVARQADAQSEKSLEQYLNSTGVTSVRAAVYGDKTLGGVINDIHETRAEPTTFTFGDQHYIGIEFEFIILAEGS